MIAILLHPAAANPFAVAAPIPGDIQCCILAFAQHYILTSAPSSRDDSDTLVQSVHSAVLPVLSCNVRKRPVKYIISWGSWRKRHGGSARGPTVGVAFPPCSVGRLLHSASISSHPNLLSFSNLSGVCVLLIPDRITSSNALMLSQSSHAARGARRSSVGAKARVCVHCGRSFRRTEHLERHVRTRNIYPPYGLLLWLV